MSGIIVGREPIGHRVQIARAAFASGRVSGCCGRGAKWIKMTCAAVLSTSLANVPSMDDLPLHIDSVSIDCLRRDDCFMHLLMRWNDAGPPGQFGVIAAEAFVTEVASGTWVFLETTDAEASRDFIQDLAKVYGWRGEVRARSVDVNSVESLSPIRVA